MQENFTRFIRFQIQQMPSAEFENEKQQTFSAESINQNLQKIRQSLYSGFYPFRLSWSHYLILMRIENENERRFYEIETANQQWTVKQLQRQFNSSLYERLALSREKVEVMRLANEGQALAKPADMLKSPLVLEFLA